MVKHQVNDDAGDTNVEPKRQRDTRDAPVTREVVTKRAVEREYHQRNNNRREDRVRRQDREVDGPHQSGALKTRRAVIEVIRQVRSQKQDRDAERRDLARTMRRDVSFSDEGVTGE